MLPVAIRLSALRVTEATRTETIKILPAPNVFTALRVAQRLFPKCIYGSVTRHGRPRCEDDGTVLESGQDGMGEYLRCPDCGFIW